MEPHLNDDQIDVFLRPAWGGEAESPFDRGTHEDAQAHLKTCKSCQERVLEQKRAVERLALLKPNAPESAGPHCPPDDVWLEVAAGIESPDPQKYLSHAVECDHCGQLLHLAAEDFAEELTPQEEAQIANLSSSTSSWQARLAAKLRESQAVTPPAPPARSRWIYSIMAHLTLSRLAFTAALAGMIVFGIKDYWLTADLSAQSAHATADVHRLEQDVLQQKKHIAELTAQLNRPGPSLTPSAPQPAEEVRIASLALDRGLSRGTGELKRLSVPPGTVIVKITLHVAESPDGVMHEDLLTVDRQKIWSQERRPSDEEKSSKSVRLLIPAYLLTPDDYLITLSRELPDGPQEVATYAFRVPR